jgi:hypothetical protein
MPPLLNHDFHKERIQMKLQRLGIVLALAVAFGACDSSTGPNGPGAPLSLSLTVPGSGPAGSAGLFAAGDITISANGHTLVITSAEVVLREIEFERAEELAGCGDDEGEIEGSEDDSCEEFETGPMLLTLPLDGSVVETNEVFVPAGQYDEMEYDIHKLGDDPLDVAFLAEPGHEGLEGVSARIEGTWDGVPFTYTADIDVEVEMDFPIPIEVVDGGSYNVTLAVDVGSWFYDGVDLIDPNTALTGEPNEEVVENRIEASFEGFEDDDGDGVPHDEDDDESDISA